MISPEVVRGALEPFGACIERDGVIAVRTQCLYPSNAPVVVYVRGSSESAMVSDDGGAIDELTSYNRIITNPDAFLRRFCRRSGLKSEMGKIHTSLVGVDQLAASILFVANASAEAVTWGLNGLKTSTRRNLKADLEGLLRVSFPADHVEHGRRFAGKSTRSYKFDNVVRMDDRRLLIVDPVVRDPNAINSHAIKHLDIGQLGDQNFIQLIVYDDDDRWAASDLNLLQMAATLTPFSHARDALRQFEIPMTAS